MNEIFQIFKIKNLRNKILIIAFFLFFLHAFFINIAAAASIQDNATGGDCSSIGIWDNSTKTCTLTTDVYETIQIDSNNIVLDGSGYWIDGYQAGLYMAGVYIPSKSGITIKNINVKNFQYGVYLLYSASSTISNNFLENNINGIYLSYSNNNIISNNEINGSSLLYFTGINLYESRNNNIIEFNRITGSSNFLTIYNIGIYGNVVTNTIFRNNTIANHASGINYGIVSGIYLTNSYYNQIYNNNFISNRFQLNLGWNVGGNVFNLSVPVGGNYWSNFDTTAEGCSDSNNDNFCDSPYIFAGGQDNLPWIKQDGWKIPVNQSPTISNLNQYKSDGQTEIQEGGITTESKIVFRATLSDPDNDNVKLQIELKEKDQNFNEQDLLESSFVNSGSEAVITKSDLTDGDYKWRARAVDDKGNISDWQELGTAGNVDFEVKLVPLYTQVRSPYPSDDETRSWFDKQYANGNSSCGSKIYRCGCALTSGVMVLRYYDITNVNSEDVNPGTLNDWLNSQPKGYSFGGSVNWLDIARYSNNLVKYDIPKSGDYLNNYVILNEYLNKNQPAIAKEKSGRGGINREHFMVIDNKLATTYGIKDPAWYNTKKLNEITDNANKIRGYENGFDGLRLFYPSNGLAVSALSFNLASPAEFLITDPLGRRYGKDPLTNTEYNEIPDASYFTESIDDPTGELSPSDHENKTLYIESPLDGQYDIKVIGTGSGSYMADSVVYDNQGQTHAQTFTGNTDTNITASYNLNYDSQQPSNISIQPSDTEPPVISHTQLNSEYILNSAPIAFNFSAQDSGVGVFKLEAFIDGQPITDGQIINFNQLGNHTIEITTEDYVGNKRTETIVYKIIYGFSGFLSPIKSDNSGIYKLGRTLPVKFQLKDANGVLISNSVAQLFVTKIFNGIVGADEIPLSTSNADTGNIFRYDTENNQYIYNLATNNLSVGSWQLKVVLDDEKYHTVIVSLK